MLCLLAVCASVCGDHTPMPGTFHLRYSEVDQQSPGSLLPALLELGPQTQATVPGALTRVLILANTISPLNHLLSSHTWAPPENPVAVINLSPNI